MVKFLTIISISLLLVNKSIAASNNLFFTSAQFMTYCKSKNIYEQGVCDGYIIAVNDVIYTLDKKKVNICIPQNISIKRIRLSLISFVIDNAELMNVEANKMIGKFFLNSFQCKK
tara:strand:- start:532 stop:876 length:345 start_codon:yes stop_codon:yes gene_type:complete